ncbi:ABC-type cobalamin/Fe3+-siderophores transport system, ATPase component [gamma proteobacterium HdN1]|nr:ABC-type cobalamin/Fe3+-siderophores transport system, ATPase component [gamma proteobacterium HdN1]
MILQAENVSWFIHEHPVVDCASLYVLEGECVGLIGPNGCGKSSLLRMLYRAVPPDTGEVQLHGRNIWKIKSRSFAQQTAVLAQEMTLPFDCSVREAVSMGRFPHQTTWLRDSSDDHAHVRTSLEQVGAWELVDRRLATLSGGERQRVWLARALAQQPQLLFLDEPTNHLDIRHQLNLMARVRELSKTTLVVLHDLNLAAQFCTRLYLMNKGRLVTEGAPEHVLTPENLRSVYGVNALVDQHPITQRVRVSYWH